MTIKEICPYCEGVGCVDCSFEGLVSLDRAERMNEELSWELDREIDRMNKQKEEECWIDPAGGVHRGDYFSEI